MAAYRGPRHTVRLVRNHEVTNAPGVFTPGVTVPGDPATRYDALAGGGCTTARLRPCHGPGRPGVREHQRHDQQLRGRPCRRTTIGGSTCEENVSGPGQGYAQKHGYVFVVPVTAESLGDPGDPLTAMGRIHHEAACDDPAPASTT